MKHFFEKILSFLHIQSVVAGLEVSDQVIRIAYFGGHAWHMHAIRLGPGVMEEGVIKDRAAFVAALGELKAKSNVVGRNPNKKVNVVVSMSSAIPYSKVFRLPEVAGESLEKAIELNLEMASPSGASEMYSGWQIVGRDTTANQVEVLSAFMERPAVDDMVDTLSSAGYIAVAVESKALALTRVFRQKGSGIDISKPYILVDVDGDGIEFLIIRNGQLYFEYDHRWADIENTKGEVPFAAFEEELKMSLRQVLNFYAKQWPEPPAAVVLSTVAFHEEIEKAIAQSISLPAVRLTLVMGQSVSPDWLVALGCSLRDGGVSFLGVELADKFRAEELLNFLSFWRLVVPGALAVLVCTFIITNVLLSATKASIESAPAYNLVPEQSAEVAELAASSTAFNNEVAAIQSIENSPVPRESAIIGDVQSMAAENSITISKMTFDGNAAISFSGIAPSEGSISSFKDAIVADTHISDFNLPLTSIQPAGQNYSFLMTFEYQ